MKIKDLKNQKAISPLMITVVTIVILVTAIFIIWKHYNLPIQDLVPLAMLVWAVDILTPPYFLGTELIFMSTMRAFWGIPTIIGLIISEIIAFGMFLYGTFYFGAAFTIAKLKLAFALAMTPVGLLLTLLGFIGIIVIWHCRDWL